MRERSNRPGRLYAAIPNEAMRDQRISAEARGTLALLMTYSDDWTFRREHLMEVLGMGRDKFQRVMKELEEAGYVGLVPVRGEGGHLVGTTWVIHDDPTESLKTRSSAESLKNRQPVEPTAGKTAPIRNNKREEEQKGRNNPPLQAEPDLFKDARQQQHDEGEKRINAAQNKADDDSASEFWAAYPACERKRDRPKVLTLFARIVQGKVSGIPKTPPETIIAAVKRYAETNPDPAYIPMPTTWLNGARWEQFPEAEKPRFLSIEERRARMLQGQGWGEVTR